MPQGKVKWFDSKKGFGFLLDPNGKDVFVHYTAIEGDGFRTLKRGEDVEFEVIEDDKGMHALKVVKKNGDQK
jgi:cold shock protein